MSLFSPCKTAVILFTSWCCCDVGSVEANNFCGSETYSKLKMSFELLIYAYLKVEIGGKKAVMRLLLLLSTEITGREFSLLLISGESLGGGLSESCIIWNPFFYLNFDIILCRFSSGKDYWWCVYKLLGLEIYSGLIVCILCK